MFTRVPVPTPFAVGKVNAYVAGRTVVDPGPEDDESWEALTASLARDGLQPTDVERVLVTHPHPDHFGLAKRFRETGASVVASERSADIVGDFRGHLEYEQSFFRPFLERCGLSPETARTVTDLPEPYLNYAPSVGVDRTLGDGDAIEVAGTEVTVDERRGHADSELLFCYEVGGQRRAVVGDHLLPEITPNPLMQPPREEGGDRPRMLVSYNESLESLEAEDFERFLPGHREPIEDPPGRIRETLAAHEARTTNVYELLESPMTPREVMDGLFPDLPVTEWFPGMSEAVGHLDVLEARDRVRRIDDGDVVRFERTV